MGGGCDRGAVSVPGALDCSFNVPEMRLPLTNGDVCSMTFPLLCGQALPRVEAAEQSRLFKTSADRLPAGSMTGNTGMENANNV